MGGGCKGKYKLSEFSCKGYPNFPVSGSLSGPRALFGGWCKGKKELPSFGLDERSKADSGRGWEKPKHVPRCALWMLVWLFEGTLLGW